MRTIQELFRHNFREKVLCLSEKGLYPLLSLLNREYERPMSMCEIEEIMRFKDIIYTFGVDKTIDIYTKSWETENYEIKKSYQN
ncbi:hypothetical protein [Persicobacter psychrovividus]|uniref:Uncharacterized protein n=1 Tax=Persicobacter psychrovividus TaxID=387638 RepID=A0ABM7VC37_9BACT|nr:hypothetical protein PEPS_05390 [Persicobacter psychrovividus]